MARILIIDDDRIQRLVASQALTQAGHQVIEATDGSEGLEIVRTHHPDLIVCDVVMPGMNGYQFVTALRQEEEIAGIPVVMLTSMAERAHMRLGMNAGADDYLAKPLSFEELTEAVDAQLAKRRALQEGLINSMNNAFITALDEQREALAAQYEQKLVEAVSGRWENAGAPEVKYDHAVILKAQIAGAIQQQVASSRNVNEMVRKAYDATRDALHLFNAVHVLPAGNDVVAIFVDDPDSIRVRANVRAVRASLSLQKALLGQRAGAAQADTSNPPANIALHCGPVTVLRISDPLHGGPVSSLATGVAMQELDAICDAARASHWGIAASATLVGEMAGKLATGRNMQAAVPAGPGPIDIIEVLSLR
jgi:CheY-like chemotaxis protein